MLDNSHTHKKKKKKKKKNCVELDQMPQNVTIHMEYFLWKITKSVLECWPLQIFLVL